MKRVPAAVGLISAAVLGFEVSLMRLLQVASWHHFAFLVISIVLLGFGASGTILTLIRPRALALGERLMWALALGTAVSIPVCCAASQHLPVEARLAPALVWRQLATWLAFWAVLTLPFLLGAAAIGLGLMLSPKRIGAVYGANLLGSAAGAVAAPLAMGAAPPQWLAVIFAAPALAATLVLAQGRPRALIVTAAGVAVAAGWLLLDPPRVRMDPYKYGSHLARLEAQDAVQRVGRRLGPRALVEAYRGPVLHDLPFLRVGRTPPPVAVLLADGHHAGSVLEVTTPEEAAVMDGTVMALAYAICERPDRVALLGESGGTNVWLALRRGAEVVDVVQPDANLLRLVTGALREHGGAVLARPEVHLHVAEPRHFVEQSDATWDLVQLAGMESSAAGSGGTGGLAENHLLTVSGIEACLRRLDDDGVLAITRGLQTPPRDNVKIMAIVLAALRRLGVEDPADHVVVARDFLAMCTVVRRTPWKGDGITQVRAAIAAASLTPVWFTGVRAEQLNEPDYLPPAPIYHDAFVELAGDRADELIDGWAFDVRPPTDDRPFFGDFFRLKGLGAIRQAYGDQWMTRTELAFAFVLAAAVIVAAVGLGATLLPLGMLPSSEGTRGRNRAVTAAYFGCLGLGYLLLEMVFLWRVSYLVGDVVAGAAVTIGGFLFFSGLGSLVTQRLRPRAGAVLVAAVAVIVILGAAQVALPGAVAAAAGGLPAPARYVVALAAIGPVALAMGAPMPMGLRGLPGPLVPWAWGVNGFGSVLAPPLAVLAAMTWGYHAVTAAALVLYLAAGGLFARLPAARD